MVHIITLCRVREAKLHIRCEGYGPICLYQLDWEFKKNGEVVRTLIVSSNIFSTGVVDAAGIGLVCVAWT